MWGNQNHFFPLEWRTCYHFFLCREGETHCWTLHVFLNVFWVQGPLHHASGLLVLGVFYCWYCCYCCWYCCCWFCCWFYGWFPDMKYDGIQCKTVLKAQWLYIFTWMFQSHAKVTPLFDFLIYDFHQASSDNYNHNFFSLNHFNTKHISSYYYFKQTVCSKQVWRMCSKLEKINLCF